MDEKKLQELMNDEEFVKQLASLKTEAEVQEAFKSKGVELSIDEIKKLGEEGKAALEDGALENVSGGGMQGFVLGYISGMQHLPTTVYQGIKSRSGDYCIDEKVGLYAGTATPWVLGAAVCGGLIYGGIKTGTFKKAYGKAQEVYGAAKDKVGDWMSSKKLK